ncbi:pilus assembly protein [Cupriavidus sp. TMH.W2]|uniref:pilus assembly protein n=1 Tax=Cupriavidus sp. TMH.W2 TaxID=3434465 RepID=UPI003D77C2A8
MRKQQSTRALPSGFQRPLSVLKIAREIAVAYPAASISRCIALLVTCTLAAMPLRGMADDIDIFIGAAGRADAPNIMVLLDNGPNWSRNSQGWDNSQRQGQSEVKALSNALNTVTATNPANIGLALLTDNVGATTNGTTSIAGGGYVRFGARDMSNATNRTAFQSILTYIGNNVTSSTEKVGGMAHKDESAGLYELYKYFSGLAPFSGAYLPNSSYPNVNADASNNTTAAYSAYGQGLRSGFAINNGIYQSPINSANPCAKNFIIYIVNNANNTGSSGLQTYEPSVATVGKALPSPTSSIDTWTDEWTLFLRNRGAVVPGGGNGSIITYVIDVYHDQNNAAYSNSLISAADKGGGKYLHADGQTDIETKLKLILAEIQGVNSTFASASLPVNTTNRAQDKNQVFIPMFRPDAATKPRWMGNLKQYQLINNGNSVALGDSSIPAQLAVNPLTGYPTDCAVSYWTTDSQQYWSTVSEDVSPKGNCTTASQFSDAPDGPFVEKGGVAEVVRKGNAPATTNATPTWTVNRQIYTQSGGNLVTFSTSTSGLSQSLVNFVLGNDVNDENNNGSVTDTRPSLHGDAIHSRPLPIDYGSTLGVTAYYGSNDGMLRAVDSATGAERWAFIAPEFFGKFQRLMDNSPLINYPTTPAGVTPTPIPKDYFFDGSIGVYQSADNSKVWIYPTMRRGGRMLYALDVTKPASPVIMWKAGCPNPTDNSNCVAPVSGDDFTGIGQTWSMPKVVPTVLGYSSPVLIVGGGYDGCEDANQAVPNCTSPKGALVYILDAKTGAVIKSFKTLRSVVADVSLVAVATAGVVDHAYAVDTGGNIYRIDFASNTSNWVMNRVAYTNGSGRKFLFAPALLPAPGGKVYLALGSGDREHPLQSQYPFTDVTNRFYVYLDDTASITATNLDDASAMKDFTNGTSCSVTGVLPGSGSKGWFMNLNQNGQGEQTVTSALIAAGMVTFSTNRPIPPSAGSCSTMLGEARGYWVNLFNGSGAIGVTGSCGGDRSATFVGGGLPPSPMFGTVPIDGQATTVVIGAVQREGGASSPISPQRVTPTIVPKRKVVYWKSNGTN